MVLVGAVILPHGAMSFDGQGMENEVRSCCERYKTLPPELQVHLNNLYTATSRASEKIAKMKPDLVVLHTPHGISLSNSVGVYLNALAKGNAEWNGEWKEFEVEVSLDKDMALKLIRNFEEDKIHVQGIKPFANTEAPLRWGEVIPLWYLNEQFKKTNCRPNYIIMSQSLNKGSNFFDEKIAVGKSLMRFIEESSKRVVVAISGDLSHTHDHNYNISLYLPDPRWSLLPSNTAEDFDRAVEGWASSCEFSLFASNASLPSHHDSVQWKSSLALTWLDHAVKLQSTALSCGIGGFVVLQGVLSQYDGDKKIESNFFGRFAPTYYGMMAVVFSVL